MTIRFCESEIVTQKASCRNTGRFYMPIFTQRTQHQQLYTLAWIHCIQMLPPPFGAAAIGRQYGAGGTVFYYENTCNMYKYIDARVNTCYNKTMEGGNNENIRTDKAA